MEDFLKFMGDRIEEAQGGLVNPAEIKVAKDVLELLEIYTMLTGTVEAALEAIELEGDGQECLEAALDGYNKSREATPFEAIGGMQTVETAVGNLLEDTPQMVKDILQLKDDFVSWMKIRWITNLANGSVSEGQLMVMGKVIEMVEAEDFEMDTNETECLASAFVVYLFEDLV